MIFPFQSVLCVFRTELIEFVSLEQRKNKEKIKTKWIKREREEENIK